MHIYLAGKIQKNDWRHSIVTGLREALTDDFYGGNGNTGEKFLQPWYQWPILPRAILNHHSYTGPFFVSCDHGCAHGDNQHGVGAANATGTFEKKYITHDDVSCWPDEDQASLHQDEQGYYVLTDGAGCIGDSGIRQERVVELCNKAISQSELVFAWIDHPDAYGTLVELGYAKALRKQIWIAGPERFPDLWFAYQIADKVLIPQSDAHTALQTMLGRPGEYLVPLQSSPSRCRECGAAIIWTKTVNQKNVPLDLSTIEERDGQQYALIHFALCPRRRQN